MAVTAAGTPYVESSDLVANYPGASLALANRVDQVMQAPTQNAQTGTTYTAALLDAGKTVTLSNASAVTLTIPAQASVSWAENTQLNFLNIGAGTVTITPAADVTINGTPLTLATSKGGSLVRTASNTWTFTPTGGDTPGLTLIATQSPSAQSSVIFNNCFSATYDNYMLISNCLSSASGINFKLRWRVGGTDATGNDYVRQSIQGSGTSIVGNRQTSTATAIGSFGSTRTLTHVDIGNPFLATNTVYMQNESASIGGANIQMHSGTHGLSVSYDGLTVYPASGTITGTIRVYGYKNS